MGHPLIRNAARDLLERTWEALPQSERTRFAFDVLTAPVIGVDGFVIEPFRVTDPGGLIDDGDLVLPERNDQTGGEVARDRSLPHSLSFLRQRGALAGNAPLGQRRYGRSPCASRSRVGCTCSLGSRTKGHSRAPRGGHAPSLGFPLYARNRRRLSQATGSGTSGSQTRNF